MRQKTAGGRAASGGTAFHAAAATFVYAAMLAKTPLTWFGVPGRVPTSISAESGGGGDDLKIGFDSTVSEAQVRHRMNASGDLTKLVDDIADRTRGKAAAAVALVAGRRDSSASLFSDVARDLNGLRTKVDEERFATQVAGMLGDPERRRVLTSLYIVDTDFEMPHSPEREMALDKLRRRLVDETRAEEAWSVLFTDALELCSTGSGRDTDDLVTVLAGKGLLLRPSTADEELQAQLDSTRERVLEQHYPELAIEELRRVLAEIDSRQGSAETRSDAMRLMAHALLALERVDEAREAAHRAVELNGAIADTHATYARTLLAGGDQASARDEVDRALAIDPVNRRAWIAHLHVSNKAGEDPGDPPAVLMLDPAFCLELAGFRAHYQRWEEVLKLSEPLLAGPEPRPAARYFHATAVMGVALAAEPADQAGFRRAENELTVLVDSLRHDHPLIAPVYFNRAQVRHLLGDADGAAADEEQLRKANRDNPELVERLAASHAGRGDVAGALAILETSIVPASQSLLAMRAGLLAGVGRIEEAKRDLEAAVDALPAAEDPERMTWQLGEVAVDLGDFERARAFHDLLKEESKTGAYGQLLRGAIAFGEKRVDEGKQNYEAAIKGQTDPAQANLLRLRLAVELRDADRPTEALAVFDEVGFDHIPDEGMRPFITTAFLAGNLVAAKRGLDLVAEKGPLPRWALSMSADIGLRSDDPAAVVKHLTELQRDGETSARVHLTLARVLIELGEMDPALEQVRVAVAVDTTPLEKLEVGIYLKRLGKVEDAVAQVFRAYREDRNDPQIQRALATMVMTGGAQLVAPATVAAGSHVRLGRADGVKRDHSIFDDPPVEKAAGELLADEAAELLGRVVGDHIVRERKPLRDEIWTVEEIVPAEVHAARTIVATFENNFPNEPFFIQAIHAGNLDKPEDFTDLLAMLGGRQDRVSKVLEIYHERVMPLEFVANMLNASVPEMMDLGRSPAGAPLLVEWAAAADYIAAAKMGEESTALVLTRSALFTARREGLIAPLLANFELVAPRSLERQLRDEVEVTKEAATKGRSTIMAAPPGWATIDVEPNDPSLVSAREDASEILAWVLANVTLLPRPLEGLGRAGDDEAALGQDALREQMGPASFDASALVASGAGILYADDLGLRRYAVRGTGPTPGISTATLIEALLLRHAIPPSERGRVHADLILAGYAFVPPSPELLAEAIHRMPGLGRPQFRTLFESLGSPLCDPRVAAGLIALVLKTAVSQTIERVSLEDVTEAAIRGFAKKGSKPAVVALIRAIATRELQLLPHHLARVEKVCDRIGAEEPPTIS